MTGSPTQVFSSEYCEILRTAFLQNISGGCFCKFDKVTVQYWGSAYFSSQSKTQCGMASTKKLSRSFQNMFFTYY